VRPGVAFVAWSTVPGRSEEFAAALGGDARCFYPFRTRRRRLVPVRYALSALQTACYLAARRPHAVIATNPPVVPGLVGWLYGRLTGAPFVLDSHAGSFGRKGDRVSARLLPMHRWLARRAALTLVADESLGALVRDWGGRPLVVHEAPPSWSVAAAGEPADPLRLLLVTVFAEDEPVGAALDAARRTSVSLVLTGNPDRCPPAVREAAERAGARFAGYLRGDAYRRALETSDVVAALTTEPSSVMRAACEAVYAGRPLIVSDWPAARRAFPYAIHVANEGASIAHGIERARSEHDRLRRLAGDARDAQVRRWHEQLAALESALSARRAAA
jgi:hypothetical protein